jgi:hypothetical protein
MIRINAVTARFKIAKKKKAMSNYPVFYHSPKASFNALSTYTDINLYAPSTKLILTN